MERWWAYTIQMATVCYMYFCDNNVSHSGTDLLTDVLLNDTYSGIFCDSDSDEQLAQMTL